MQTAKERRDKRKLIQYENVLLGSKEKICGIYGIIFQSKKGNENKIYVGSSVDIVRRCKNHVRQLDSNQHYSKKLLSMYKNTKYNMSMVILERCEENQVMQKEREHQYNWEQKDLLNTWRAINKEDIVPWLEKAIKSKRYLQQFKYSETNFYNGTPCRESLSVDPDGYGKVQVTVNNKRRDIRKHRAAYYEVHGEYPELVRHLCNNKCCYNPDHLISGNHSDNGLDRRGDFPERFERDWVRLEGDADKLTTLYGWKRNCVRQGVGVSTAVYSWERKLGLREEYPDIYYNKRAIRTKLWKRKDIQEFIQMCEGRYGRSNIKIAKALNMEYGLELTANQVSNMKIKIRGKKRNRKRVKNGDLTGASTIVKEYYRSKTDEQIKDICNSKLGTSYKTGQIRGLRFDLSLYKPQIIQDKVGDLYRRDAISKWGIEAEKLVEYFGSKYSDKELVQICKREYGEDMGFDENAIIEMRELIGSKGLLGQT